MNTHSPWKAMRVSRPLFTTRTHKGSIMTSLALGLALGERASTCFSISAPLSERCTYTQRQVDRRTENKNMRDEKHAVVRTFECGRTTGRAHHLACGDTVCGRKRSKAVRQYQNANLRVPFPVVLCPNNLHELSKTLAKA